MRFILRTANSGAALAATIVALVLTASATLMPAADAAAVPTIVVNGQAVAFDQPPIEKQGRVYVPLRGVFERLGASVVWTPPNIITAQRANTSVRLLIGSTTAYVNGAAQSLDAPPFLSGRRSLVPLRFISQALGASVNWMANTNTVYIDLTAASAPPVVVSTMAPLPSATPSATPSAATSPEPTAAPTAAAAATPFHYRGFRKAPLLPPANLQITTDQAVCGQHYPNPFAAAAICTGAIDTGKIILIWDSEFGQCPGGQNCRQPDGYHVYATHVRLVLNGARLIDTINGAANSASIIDPTAAPTRCFAVTAFHGDDESDRSPEFCVP